MALHSVRPHGFLRLSVLLPRSQAQPQWKPRNIADRTELLRHEDSAEVVSSAGIGSWARDFRREGRLLLVGASHGFPCVYRRVGASVASVDGMAYKVDSFNGIACIIAG
jgi:hypothetical protein